VLEHLVKTGAFDFSGAARKPLFDSIDSAIAGAAAHARDKAAGQNTFLDMLAEEKPKKKAVITTNGATTHTTTAADFSSAERLQFEKELLGFYVSGHPLNAYSGLAEALCTHTEESVLLEGDRVEFRLCGIMSSINKKLSKKDNRPWAFFNLASKRAAISVNMYADAYESYNQNLAENAPVVVLGTVMKGNDGARLNVKELYPLDAYLQNHIRKVTWLLTPDHPQLTDWLKALRATLDSNGGDTRVEMAFLFENRVAPIAEVAGALKWRLAPEACQRLRAHPAVAGLHAEARPLELKEVKKRWGKRG
jgi:DNA polymerase III subunit alpha